MTREELIEERKDMTNEEVIKAVIGKMAESYRVVHHKLRVVYKQGKMEGWDSETLNDMKVDMHNAMIKSVVLEDLRGTLDERCSAYVNGIDYA